MMSSNHPGTELAEQSIPVSSADTEGFELIPSLSCDGCHFYWRDGGIYDACEHPDQDLVRRVCGRERRVAGFNVKWVKAGTIARLDALARVQGVKSNDPVVPAETGVAAMCAAIKMSPPATVLPPELVNMLEFGIPGEPNQSPSLVEDDVREICADIGAEQERIEETLSLEEIVAMVIAAVRPSNPEPASEPLLPCDLRVGAVLLHKNVPISTAQGTINRLYARMRELEPPLTEAQIAACKALAALGGPGLATQSNSSIVQEKPHRSGLTIAELDRKIELTKVELATQLEHDGRSSALNNAANLLRNSILRCEIERDALLAEASATVSSLGMQQLQNVPSSDNLTGPPQFPTMLRKMWSGGEVQQWIESNWVPTAPADRWISCKARLPESKDAALYDNVFALYRDYPGYFGVVTSQFIRDFPNAFSHWMTPWLPGTGQSKAPNLPRTEQTDAPKLEAWQQDQLCTALKRVSTDVNFGKLSAVTQKLAKQTLTSCKPKISS